MTIDFAAYTTDALDAFQQGNLPLADVLCDTMLRAGTSDPLVHGLQGMVAYHVGEFRRAVDLLTYAEKHTPGDRQLKDALAAARKGAREQAMIRPDGRKRYMVIKAWGYGFCSDLDHVLGGLLLAEMTGRTPVVEWGRGSLFRDDPDENAWPRFFEPVSSVLAADLTGKKLGYFPPKWNDANLLEAEVNKFDGPWSRMGACLYLNRREDVAVCDFPTPIASLVSWLRPGSPYAGKSVAQVYRMMITKYLRPRPELSERVDAFAKQHFTGSPMIGVHARGGDKPVEDPLLGERNKSTPEMVEALLAKHPTAKVFLLTDDENMRQGFTVRFGDKLVTADCVRTTTAHGLHYLEQQSRTRLGVEVLVDMYLAARCDYFIGVGTSNVSAMIDHLKDWPEGAIDIRPFSIHERLSPFLYRHTLPPDQEAAFLASVAAQKAREAQGG